MRPLAFVDLETTGATATADRITEIGIIEVDPDGSVRTWQQLVNPGQTISPFIEQLTGISNAMVADAPAFGEVAHEALARLQGRLFIAHNARFDYGFLKNEFKRLDIAFRAPVLCTVKLSRALYPNYTRHNLDSLIERHGLKAEARHRALADAQLIHQFWRAIHEQLPAEQIEAAIKAQQSHPSLPPHLDARLLEELPETPGVYLFHGENALPLYIGKAKDLRKRVLSHFAADHRSASDAALAQQVKLVEWIETTGEIGALLREATLIKQLQPIHNRLLRRNDELCSWRLIDEGNGWQRPQLTPAEELDFDAEQPAYGLFKNTKEANQMLRALAESHHLCDQLLGLEKRPPGSKPCFGYQVRRCKGACLGKEPFAQHTLRMLAGLGKHRLQNWPFPGPALIREGTEAHLVDRWRYLGSARSDQQLAELLAGERPPFDRDTYRILVRHLNDLSPVPRATPTAED